MSSEETTHEEEEETPPLPHEQTFGQRHGVTILTVALFGMLALVMFIQMAC